MPGAALVCAAIRLEMTMKSFDLNAALDQLALNHYVILEREIGVPE